MPVVVHTFDKENVLFCRRLCHFVGHLPSPAEIHSVEDKFDAVEVAQIELEEGHIICGLIASSIRKCFGPIVERHSPRQNIHDDR